MDDDKSLAIVLHDKTPPLNEMQGSRYDAPLTLSANAYSAPACSGNFRDSVC